MALSVTSGNLFYGTGTQIAELAIGSNDQVLKVQSGLPAWAASSGFTVQSGVAISGSVVLQLFGAGTLTHTVMEDNYYYYFPEIKMCYMCVGARFKASSTDSSTAIAFYNGGGAVLNIQPKICQSGIAPAGNTEGFYTLGDGFILLNISGTTSYWRGNGLVDAANTELSPRVANSTSWGNGGWSDATDGHRFRVAGWFPTES